MRVHDEKVVNCSSPVSGLTLLCRVDLCVSQIAGEKDWDLICCWTCPWLQMSSPLAPTRLSSWSVLMFLPAKGSPPSCQWCKLSLCVHTIFTTRFSIIFSPWWVIFGPSSLSKDGLAVHSIVIASCSTLWTRKGVQWGTQTTVSPPPSRRWLPGTSWSHLG